MNEPGTTVDGTTFARRLVARLTPRTPRARAVAAGALVLLLVIVWWLHVQLTTVSVDDARIANDMVAVSSRVAGWVTARQVIDGDTARKGQLLVAVDMRDSRLLLAEVEARLAGIVARRAELEARIGMTDRSTASAIRARSAAAQAAVAAAASTAAQLTLAQSENERAERLEPIGAIGRAELDQTRTALETARQRLHSSEAEAESARAGVAQAQAEREQLTVLRRQLEALVPEERQLQAERDRLRLDLQDREIRMPFDGVVDRTFVDPGEYVSPGQRLLLVHDPARIRVDANVKETDIRHFRIGKEVRITVDALPGQEFKGVVERVGQAATSEFALLPNPNPSGNFTKITQRLPVRIAVQQEHGELKPGMMVEVEARTGG